MLIYCEELAWAAPKVEDAFWKKRPELFVQVEQQRAILVSAKRSSSNKNWSFVGGGHINADLDRSWDTVRKYELLSRLTWVFQKVQYERQTQEIHLWLKFLGFERQLVVKIIETKDPKRGILQFQVTRGYFQGLEGVMSLLSFSEKVTEASVVANYEGDVGLSDWMFARGAEVVMHYVASELRKIIEQPETVGK